MPVDSSRTAFRRQAREQALELAAQQLTELRWDQIRIGNIAKAVGVNGGPSATESLLPFATTKSDALMATSTQALLEWFSQRCPSSSRRDISDAVDTLIRVVISHMLGSDEKPRQTAAQAGRIAAKLLPEFAG